MDGYYREAMPRAGALWVRWLGAADVLWRARWPFWVTIGLLALVGIEGVRQLLLYALSSALSGVRSELISPAVRAIATAVVLLPTAFFITAQVRAGLREYYGRPTRVGDALTAGGQYFLPILGLQLLIILFILAARAILLFIILAVTTGLLPYSLVYLQYGLVGSLIFGVFAEIIIDSAAILGYPIVLVEKERPVRAFAASWYTIRNYLPTTFFLLLLLLGPWNAALIGAAFIPSPGRQIVLVILYALYYTVIFPLWMLLSVLAYTNLRAPTREDNGEGWEGLDQPVL